LEVLEGSGSLDWVGWSFAVGAEGALEDMVGEGRQGSGDGRFL
jgi:hypothetical protein